MFLVLIQIILIITMIVFVVLGLIGKTPKTADSLGITFKPNSKLVFALMAFVLWIGTTCIVIIPANTVGIKYSAISGVSEETLGEGLAFKTPIDQIYMIDTTVQEKIVDNVSVQTKDAQWVSMNINVKYSVNSSNAFKVFKSYKTLDNLQNALIANATQRSIEEVTTKFNVMEVLGEERNAIYTEIENNLKERLAIEGVDLKFITISDTDAGEEIENAIAKEAVAKKNAETALQEQEKAKIEAETKLIEAEGEAKANAVKTEALTKEVLIEMWINKWNGVLPTVSGSDSTIIDISELLKQAE